MSNYTNYENVVAKMPLIKKDDWSKKSEVERLNFESKTLNKIQKMVRTHLKREL